jgi:hypothetical protein
LRCTQVAILRENGDLRTAQRGLITREAGAQQIKLPALRVDLRFEPLALQPQPGEFVIAGSAVLIGGSPL